jgi:hypothetical protein
MRNTRNPQIQNAELLISRLCGTYSYYYVLRVNTNKFINEYKRSKNFSREVPMQINGIGTGKLIEYRSTATVFASQIRYRRGKLLNIIQNRPFYSPTPTHKRQSGNTHTRAHTHTNPNFLKTQRKSCSNGICYFSSQKGNMN